MSKKVDVSFMKICKTDDEWTRDVMDAGGKLLCIVDVYSKVWGPCEMLAGHFSNMYFDFGEKYGMRFVRAEADSIAALKDFRDSSDPVFLFYLNGEPVVDTIHGSVLPAIMETITEKAPPPS